MSRDEIPPPKGPPPLPEVQITASHPPQNRWEAIAMLIGSATDWLVCILLFALIAMGVLPPDPWAWAMSSPALVPLLRKLTGKAGGSTIGSLVLASKSPALKTLFSKGLISIMLVVSGCGLLGGQGGHSFPELPKPAKIREDLARCEGAVYDAVASYRQAIELASAACTYAAAQELAAAACGLAEHASQPVAEVINHALPATPTACEGLRRKARAADLTLRSAAAWGSVAQWYRDVAEGREPAIPTAERVEP